MIQSFIQADKNASSSNHNHHVDTAYIYAGGKTEKILGQIFQEEQKQQGLLFGGGEDNNKISIGIKAHPSFPTYGLSRLGIQKQYRESLERMNLSNTQSNSFVVDELYLHQPDPQHSLLESLQTLNEMVVQGKIQRIGMSNYHVDEMKRAFELCEIYGLTPPSVYQGLYNPLNRLVEQELLPLLESHSCSFVAYNPLAAGMLTGKYLKINQQDNESDVPQGRFQNNPNYLPRFYTPSNFEALEVIQQVCDAEDITMVQATYRWMMNHSQLNGEKNDGILIGASSMSQLNENMNSCTEAMIGDGDEGTTSIALSKDMLDAFDKAWDIVNSEESDSNAFPYWRSYSLDMPNRDNLDEGASYNAAKTK
mmetsp:Transcript_31670/g.48565  ORF Transcript_31670/g.48565 Transcript_31670/m.48565 type:complete len:365 (+) Transcript_31670:3-1097(+)